MAEEQSEGRGHDFGVANTTRYLRRQGTPQRRPLAQRNRERRLLPRVRARTRGFDSPLECWRSEGISLRASHMTSGGRGGERCRWASKWTEVVSRLAARERFDSGPDRTVHSSYGPGLRRVDMNDLGDGRPLDESDTSRLLASVAPPWGLPACPPRRRPLLSAARRTATGPSPVAFALILGAVEEVAAHLLNVMLVERVRATD